MLVHFKDFLHLVNGELSDKAKEGRKVFEKLKCGECHSGPYYTDMKMHRIGEDIEFEKGWDTPTLREVWRTTHSNLRRSTDS